MAELRIGISGWTYPPWRKRFYPEGLAQKEELAFASRQVNSIEINGTFYSLQRPNSFAHWYEQTPDDFVFSVKGGRYITHLKRLKDIEAPLANFFASGVLRLGRKLGPILWQFPPNFRFDEEKMRAFFAMLPTSTADAVTLARRHDDRMKGRSWMKTDRDRRIRYALEIRHESFADPAFIALLRRHRIALCVADTAGKWPFLEDVTADFIYARLHGDAELYVSGYTDTALDNWADKIRHWQAGREAPGAIHTMDQPPPARKSRDVYVYFDNDVKVRAPIDAINLARRLGLPAGDLRAETFDDVTEQPRRHWPTIKRKK